MIQNFSIDNLSNGLNDGLGIVQGIVLAVILFFVIYQVVKTLIIEKQTVKAVQRLTLLGIAAALVGAPMFVISFGQWVITTLFGG